jgi:hypothetical protein
MSATNIMARRAVLSSVALLVVMALGGSRPQGVSLSDREADVPPCQGVQEPLPVSALADAAESACDLAGVRVVFSDGFEFLAPKVLHTEGTTIATGGSEKDYAYFNLGVYGVVASYREGDHPRKWWGSKVGVTKLRDACRCD